MNVRDVDDLDRGLATRYRANRVGWFCGGEFDRVWCDGRIITQSKNCSTEQLRGVRGNGHLTKVVSKNRSFEGNGSSTDIVVFDL